MKILPDIRHCMYWVFVEIWALESSHKIFNKFFIHHYQGWKESSFLCESVWFFYLSEYSSVWGEICRVLSQIQSRFLRGISGKNYFGTIFLKFCEKPRLYPLAKFVKFRPTFCNFILCWKIRWKIYTSTFVCCLHPAKEARS